MSVEILVFELDGRRFGVRAEHVQEVLGAVTFAPTGVAGVEGLINLRGRGIAVADVRAKFGLAGRPVECTDHLVVIRRPTGAAAFRADRVVDLVRIEPTAIEPARSAGFGAGPLSEIATVPDGAIPLLDPGALTGVADGPGEDGPPAEALRCHPEAGR